MRSPRPVLVPLVLLAALVPAASASALSADPPIVTFTGFVSGAYEYRAVGHAKTDEKHNRSEGQIIMACKGESSPTSTHFTSDYASTRTDFVTPTATFVVLEGQTCDFTVAWLIGGGGTVGEAGNSAPTTITAAPQPTPRFTDDTKAKAAGLRDSFRRVAAKNMTLGSNVPGLQPLIGISAVESALGSVAGQVANDPPDRHYKTKVKRRRVAPASVGADVVGTAAAAMNAYGAAIADASASGIALTTAINRASGARAAKRKGFDRSQMLAAAGFGKRLASELKTLRAAQKAAGVALRACGCPLATQLADGSAWRDLRDGFVINGTPPSYAAELRRLGIPAALAQSAGLDLSTIDQLLPGTLADELDNVQELHSLDLLRTALTGWAKAVKRHPLATAPG